MSRFISFFRMFLRPILIACAAAVVARAALVQVYAIPSGSMAPTLQPGDQVIATPYRFPWLASAARRGDVVVFRRPDGAPGYFVKRVIGTPGDHLEIRDGIVLINGRPALEPYVLYGTPSAGDFQPDIVPLGSYFVMGDHRSDSIDSRSWGYVPQSAIAGRARLVFWSAAGDSSHTHADASAVHPPDRPHERIRWERILTVIR
jgi:signal peptidase I